MKKLIIPIVVIAITIFGATQIQATNNNQVCFCHNVNNNPHTICTSNQGQINGHMKHTKNGDDYLGSCNFPTSTPTSRPTPTVCSLTPTHTPTPSNTPMPTITDTPTPTLTVSPSVTATPSATPTVDVTPSPTSTPSSTTSSSSDTQSDTNTVVNTVSTPQCTDKEPVGGVDNPHIYRKGSDAIAKWYPDASKAPKVHIWYYQNENPSNIHVLRDVINDGYEDDLHFLSDLNWTFGIQPANGCNAGEIQWIVDDTTDSWVLFRP